MSTPVVNSASPLSVRLDDSDFATMERGNPFATEAPHPQEVDGILKNFCA